MGGSNDLASANEQGRNVAAIDVLQFAIAAQTGDDNRRVLFTDVLAGEIAIR